MKLKKTQNLSYRFFRNFGSKRDSPQQINCENFILGCTVGFRAILDQRQAFITLDKNWIAHALYLSARLCDAMYRVWESKSKLELFYRMFIKLCCHIIFWPSAWIHVWTEFETMATYTKEIWRLSSAEVVFDNPGGYLRHFCTRDKYWRDVWQAIVARATKSRKNCSKAKFRRRTSQEPNRM